MPDERFLEHLIASTPGIVFRVDAREWRTTYISPSVERILGYGVDEVLADPDFWTNRVHPDDRAAMRSRLATVPVEQPESLIIEAAFRHALGHYRTLQMTMRCRYDAGVPNELIGSIVDVTEWRAAVGALREAEHQAVTMAKRMRAVADAVAGLVMADSVDVLQDVLRSACAQVIDFDVFTFALYDEAAGTLDFLATWDADVYDVGEKVSIAGTPSEWVVAHGRSLRSGCSDDPVLSGCVAFGTGRKSESSIRTPVIAGRETLAVISVQSYTPDLYDDHDVEVLEALAASAATGLRMLRAGERRRQAERDRERLVSILEATPDFIGIFAADGQPLYINRGGRALLGLSDDQSVAGEPLLRYLSAAGRERLVRETLPAVLEQGSWSGETTLRAHDGREVPVLQHVVAHRDDNGTVDYLSTISRDLTVYKRLEHELLQSQKMDAVGRLAGGIAHDFNNLMTAIIGHAAFLLDQLGEDSPVRDDAVEIRRAAESATALTRQLLAFSRKQVLRPETIELNEVITQMVTMLERLIPGEITFTLQLDVGAGNVRADRLQLQQVVLNLVVNARDAMPDGGKLRIATQSVRLHGAADHHFAHVPDGEYALLTVADSGHGMDAATLGRIWEPFFTTKEPGRGTGLGLPTVYGIVQQSGGHIEVTSAPGHGTTVHVLLPLAAGAAQVATPAVDTEAPRSDGARTILLAEDDAAVRRIATRILTRAGYTVFEAVSGEDALRVYDSLDRPVDLLLTDVVMPGMGGPALARRLTELQPDLTVLFTSGYTENEAIRRGVLTAGIHFVEKPFSPGALLMRVREALTAGEPVGG